MAYYTEKKCTVKSAEDLISQDCFMISVANGKRYGGGFCVAPRAEITDGMLDVGIVGKISALKRMKYLPVIEKGAHLELPFVRYYKTREVEISCGSVLPAHLDGEYISADKFHIRCLPKRFLFCY
jgi:diacylglycerol kinase family enzyme